MHKKGFTLIELMVTVTIMMIMTAVVLFNYNTFNDSSLLSNFAYDMSLTIRQAQVYGTSGGETNQGAVTVSNASINSSAPPFGVHFIQGAMAPNPSLILFVGNPANVLQSYTFQRGISIKQICVSSSGNSCASTPSTLDITFLHPNPEAIISGGDGSMATIILQNAGSSPLTKKVVVYSTGQISVQ